VKVYLTFLSKSLCGPRISPCRLECGLLSLQQVNVPTSAPTLRAFQVLLALPYLRRWDHPHIGYGSISISLRVPWPTMGMLGFSVCHIEESWDHPHIGYGSISISLRVPWPTMGMLGFSVCHIEESSDSLQSGRTSWCKRCPRVQKSCWYCLETQGSQCLTCGCQYGPPMPWVLVIKVPKTWATKPVDNHNIKSSQSNQSLGTIIIFCVQVNQDWKQRAI